jgi:hypothetical protein
VERCARGPAAADAGSKTLSLDPPTSGRDESYAIRLSAAAILLESSSLQTALKSRSVLWRRAEHSRENIYDQFQ